MHHGHVASLVAVLAVCLLRAGPVTSSVTTVAAITNLDSARQIQFAFTFMF